MIKTLNTQISRLGQKAEYHELLQMEEHRLKIEIISDSYPSQCRAWIYRHDGDKWQFLAEIPIPLMVTRPGLAYVVKAPDASSYAPDRDELVRLAKLILL